MCVVRRLLLISVFFVLLSWIVAACSPNSGQSTVWERADSSDSVPTRFRYAMFLSPTSATQPLVPRIVLNSERERQDELAFYAVFDDVGVVHEIPKTEFLLDVEEVSREQQLAALNQTLIVWGEDTDMEHVELQVGRSERGQVVVLDIHYRDGHTERFEYEVRDGVPHAQRWSADRFRLGR